MSLSEIKRIERCEQPMWYVEENLKKWSIIMKKYDIECADVFLLEM